MDFLYKSLFQNSPLLYSMRAGLAPKISKKLSRVLSLYDQSHPQVKTQQSRGFLFIHIPKCAGTSFEKSLKMAGSGHATCHLHQLRLTKAEYQKLYKFCIVRNPYDRFFSIYRYLTHGADRLAADVKLRNEKIFGPEPTFESFTNTCFQKKLYRHDQFFKPMTSFVCPIDSPQLLVDFVGRFEDLNNSYNTIAKTVGITTHLKEENISRQKKDNLSNVYNPAIAEMVKEMYTKDFEVFRYDQNQIS